MSAAAEPAASRGPVLLPVVPSVRPHPFEPARVEGRLPDALRGTLYRNGPARFGRGVDHWFDGDGAITAVRLDGQGASVAVGYTVDEQSPALARYRHPGTLLNVVRALLGGSGFAHLPNIHVLPWQGGLYALAEGGAALRFDPDTLAPVGTADFDGLAPSLQAHPHWLPSRRTTYLPAVRVGRQTLLELLAFPEQGSPQRVASLPIPGIGEIHDFFVTERHAVFLLCPLWGGPLDLLRARSFEGALRWQPEQGTEVVVVPFDAPQRLVRFRTEPFFWWHGANAWDLPDGRIGLEWVRYPDFGTSEWLDALHRGVATSPTQGELCRGEIDPAARTLVTTRGLQAGVEFPTVSPVTVARPHRYTWLAAQAPGGPGTGWFDRLVRFDAERGEPTWVDPGPDTAVSEPTVVPHGADELDAWVLAILRSATETRLGVWEASAPEAGPIAAVSIGGPMPATLHGCWVAAAGP